MDAFVALQLFMLMYLNKSQIMCFSDLVFWKYKQDSAFHVSGVLQLAKLNRPSGKEKVPTPSPESHVPLRCQIYMARRFLWPQLYLFAYFDCVRNPAHFLLELANFKAGEKILTCLSEAQTQKLWISATARLSGIKWGQNFHFKAL